MWTAAITKKDFSSGQLRVIVSFTDSVNTFEEAYYLNTGDELDNLIVGRLAQAEKLSAFSLPIGGYTSPQKTVVPPDPKIKALAKLQELQQYVTLGILDEADPSIAKAISDVKATL